MPDLLPFYFVFQSKYIFDFLRDSKQQISLFPELDEAVCSFNVKWPKMHLCSVKVFYQFGVEHTYLYWGYLLLYIYCALKQRGNTKTFFFLGPQVFQCFKFVKTQRPLPSLPSKPAI
jgi:hypothetical protein